MKPFTLIAFAAVFVLAIATAFAFNSQEPMRLPVDPDRLQILSADQSAQRTEFDLEIADDTRERSAGLMHRTDLPKDRGMLFVWPEASQRFFWMENTPTPLDIIFANGTGQVVRIARDTVPFSTSPIPSGQRAKYVLEIHAGLSSKFGLQVGDLLIHPAISAVGAQ
ncbi:MAG: DUF192 domain-containing protein [Pseudomonadota bacterium]